MKTQLLIALLLVAALAGNLLVLQRERHLEATVAALHPTPSGFPLNRTMDSLQRSADTLWRAAKAGNWALAAYYRDQMDKTAAAIVDARLVVNGFPVSTTLQKSLRPALANLEKPLGAKDSAGFASQYQQLIASCNACHRDSGRPFIRIATPTPSADRWNQNFNPR